MAPYRFISSLRAASQDKRFVPPQSRYTQESLKALLLMEKLAFEWTIPLEQRVVPAMPNSPTSVRIKSAPSYRALGTRSPSLNSHEEAEHEYTFVRAIVDAMNSKSSPPASPPPDPAPNPAFNPGEWPAMYVSHQPGIDSTQPSSPLPFQRHFNGDAKAPPTPVLASRSKTSIGIDLSSRSRQDSTTIQTSPSSVLKPDSGVNGYKYRPRKFSFSSPNPVVDRTMVVPLNSPSMVNLQLTGDVKQMCKPERPSTNYRSPRSRPKAFLLRRNLDKRSHTTLEATPITPKQTNQKLALAPQSESSTGDGEVTKYRFRLRSARRNHSMTSPRPATSADGKFPQRDSEIHTNRYSTAEKENTNLRSEERTTRKGRFEREYTGVKPVSRSYAVPRSGRFRSREAERSRTDFSQSVDQAEHISDEITESSGGHTRFTKTPGTLSLSVFLPREISSADRSCQRSMGMTPSPRSSRVEDTEQDNVDASSTVAEQDPHSSDDDTNNHRKDEAAEETTLQSKSARATGSDLRRSLHCELFGPDLCGDCKRHNDREDVKAWQHMVYPGIVADPKILVAAPMLRRQQARLGIEPSIPYIPKPKSAGPQVSKPATGGPKQTASLVYSSATQDSNLPQPQNFGVHPWRLTGPGSSITRTLKSVVTQNEIRTRIWASSESPRSRRQGLALVM